MSRSRYALALGLLLTVSAAAEQPSPAPARPDGETACVDVAVNDHPVLAYDCLNRQLALRPVLSSATDPRAALDAVTRLPPNQQVGQFNLSALSNRMGANLGKSVYPQRPPTPQWPVNSLLPVPPVNTGH
jgi:hypothetical protein